MITYIIGGARHLREYFYVVLTFAEPGPREGCHHHLLRASQEPDWNDWVRRKTVWIVLTAVMAALLQNVAHENPKGMHLIT